MLTDKSRLGSEENGVSQNTKNREKHIEIKSTTTKCAFALTAANTRKMNEFAQEIAKTEEKKS